MDVNKHCMKQMDGWMDGYMKINTARYGWMNEWMHGWMVVNKHYEMDGWLVGWLVG